MKKTILSLCCLFFLGCTHLLYPASREAFVDIKKLKPAPNELSIPTLNFYESISDQKNIFPNETGNLHAWHFASQTPQSRAVLVHFHGNGQNLTTHFFFFVWAIKNGFDYLIFDYRGYGQSSDEDATPEKTIQDGMSILKYAKDKFPNKPIIAIGQSLGSNVLTRTLQELNSREHLKKYLPDMVVFDSAFLSYKEAASSVMSQRWFLYPLKPISYLVMNNEWAAVKKTDFNPNIPALYFHGTQDPVIHYELGRDSFELWKGPKAFVDLQDGKHTAAFDDSRFIKSSRETLLTCIEYAINKSTNFQDCVKK